MWAEEMNLLYENQAGFRKGRSTADATQVFIRIQEDSVMLQNAIDGQGQPTDCSEQPQASLLDLKKAAIGSVNLYCGKFWTDSKCQDQL